MVLVGTAALLIYELLLTFDHEYELIWKCVASLLAFSLASNIFASIDGFYRKPNKSFIKWLFFFIRYFALLSQM